MHSEVTVSAVCACIEHVPHTLFSFLQLLACIHIMFDEMCTECEVLRAVECVIHSVTESANESIP